MADSKSEVTLSRAEYDKLTKAAAGPGGAPKGDGPQYDERGFKTVEGMEDVDLNGDGHISKQEMDMHLEFKRKELEDADAMRDAQRKMAWFSLYGMLLYPVVVVGANFAKLGEASQILGDMAGVYFIAVAGIVAAFFGAQAWTKGK